jgi:methionine synthase I (cobalamin-dependent)
VQAAHYNGGQFMNALRSLFPEDLVITDGAWGTEFQKRGLPLGEPSDLWNLTRPAEVEAVARAYVEAGSRVILTNTFRGNPVSLGSLGLADRALEINRRGAELSREAAGSAARVFGTMGPTGRSLSTGEIDARTVFDAFEMQAEALAAGGVEAILYETLSDIEEARVAVAAARSIGLPILVSFAFFSGEHNDRTMTGASPEDAGRAMVEVGADAVGANCGLGPDLFPSLCRRLKEASGLPVWMKPNAGVPVVKEGRAVYALTPEAFARSLIPLARAGATFVGGCCGTSPEFVRALTKLAEAETE